jgi:hypothetical protein
VEATAMDVEGSVGLASGTAVACLLLGDSWPPPPSF